jgi:hypothetical protein
MSRPVGFVRVELVVERATVSAISSAAKMPKTKGSLVRGLTGEAAQSEHLLN